MGVRPGGTRNVRGTVNYKSLTKKQKKKKKKRKDVGNAVN